MTLKRVNARVIDCSKVRVEKWLSDLNAAGRRTIQTARFVSFHAVFPGYRPGEIVTLFADELRLEIDGRNIRRETFVGRWNGMTEGFIFEDFQLAGHGQMIPVIRGFALARSELAHA